MKRLLPPLLVAFAATAVFSHTLGFDFVYDDVWVIVTNTRLHSLAGWRDILGGAWWQHGLYRPFTSLTLAANWSLGNGSPAGFHLVNVLLHAIASLLVYALVAGWLPRPGALAASLLFAVHPVHVEAVANVVGRAEILATLFTLAAALLYQRHGDLAREAGRPGPGTALGTLAMVTLGLASKETAFAAPGLLLVADWLRAHHEGRPFRIRFGRQRTLWAAVLLVSVAWLLLRTRVLGDLAGDRPAPGLAGTGPGERALIMLPVVPQYLRLLLFPARLSADYSPDFLPVSTAFTAGAALGLACLAGCVGLAVLARRRAPAVTAGVLWVGVSLLIVANVILPTGILLAERTLYLASVGVCLALGWLAVEALRRQPSLATAVLVLGVALLAGRSYDRASVWRSNTTFFPQLVRDAPGSYRAAWVGGMLSYMAGDSAGGERLIRQGLRIYPGNGAMWSDFAKVMEKERRWREAGDYHWAAYQADPQLRLDAARAVATYVQAGELDTAAARLAIAERELPPFTELTIAASHLALARGDGARATALRASVARAHPADYRFWLLAGQAALRARDCTTAAESISRLEALRPNLSQVTGLRADFAALHCGRDLPAAH